MMAHLERDTEDGGKSEHLVLIFIFKSLPLHITCTGLSQTSLSEKGWLVQQLAFSGSRGKGSHRDLQLSEEQEGKALQLEKHCCTKNSQEPEN